MILGLDVSTSIIGVTILDGHGNLLMCESWDLRNKKYYPSLYVKGKKVQEKFNEMIHQRQFRISQIYIEDSLQSFRPGFSSAKIITTLAKMGGIVGWLCEEVFSIPPEYLNSKTARKTCGIKVLRGQNAKEIALNHMLKKEPACTIEYTKKGNPKPGSYDQADSLVIAKAGYYLNNRRSNEEQVNEI